MLIVFVAMVMLAVAAMSAIAGGSPGATIVGTVTLTAADGGSFPAGGARVTLECPADGTTRTEVSDERGAFRFLNVPIDSCSIQADVQGFVGQPAGVVTAAQQVVATDLQLGVVPLSAGVNVGGTASLQEPTMLTRSCRSEAGRRPERSAKKCTH